MKRFNGKIVLVTGGNRNTGLDLVERFVREGAKVYMCGSSADSTAKGAAELKTRGVEGVTAQPCDISDPNAVAALFDKIADGRHPIKSRQAPKSRQMGKQRRTPYAGYPNTYRRPSHREISCIFHVHTFKFYPALLSASHFHSTKFSA